MCPWVNGSGSQSTAMSATVTPSQTPRKKHPCRGLVTTRSVFVPWPRTVMPFASPMVMAALSPSSPSTRYVPASRTTSAPGPASIAAAMAASMPGAEFSSVPGTAP